MWWVGGGGGGGGEGGGGGSGFFLVFFFSYTYVFHVILPTGYTLASYHYVQVHYTWVQVGRVSWSHPVPCPGRAPPEPK